MTTEGSPQQKSETPSPVLLLEIILLSENKITEICRQMKIRKVVFNR